MESPPDRHPVGENENENSNDFSNFFFLFTIRS